MAKNAANPEIKYASRWRRKGQDGPVMFVKEVGGGSVILITAGETRTVVLTDGELVRDYEPH